MKITRDNVLKRSTEFIALCYVVYLIGSVGFVLTATSLDSTGVLEVTESVNIIGIHQVIKDYGAPADYDVEFFEKSFDARYAGKTVIVNFTLKDCILEDVYAYRRYWERKSTNESGRYFDVIKYGDPTSLLKLGRNMTVTFQVSDEATSTTPFVLIIVVTPMGWNGGNAIHRGMITVRTMMGLV